MGRLAESGLANPRRDEAVCRQGGEGREEGDAPKARLPDTDHRQLHKPSEAILSHPRAPVSQFGILNRWFLHFV